MELPNHETSLHETPPQERRPQEAAPPVGPAEAGAPPQTAESAASTLSVPIPPQRPATPVVDVARANELLRAGGLVAFPTETVYGLGTDASNAEALARLYKVKGRPGSHPVIVHLSDVGHLDAWAVDIPDAARHLAKVFWPGPLTLVLKRAAHVLDAVTGGQDTVALRVPSHPLALALLDAFAATAQPASGDDSSQGSDAAPIEDANKEETGEAGPPAAPQPRGIAAPSANRYGKVSPTTAAHVSHDLGADIDGVIDGGPCEVGLESTIVDCSRRELGPLILRPGRISAADIERALGEPVVVADAAAGAEAAPRAPGSHASHYAPRARLRLVTRREIIDTLVTNRGRRIAVLALEVSVPRLAAGLSVVVPAVAAQYAKGLYANLRQLDATGADLILVERPPASPNWTAVQDRLCRAETPAEPVKMKQKGDAEADGRTETDAGA